MFLATRPIEKLSHYSTLILLHTISLICAQRLLASSFYRTNLQWLVWVTNFGRLKVILPVESETGQEIIFRTSDILPVQEHKGFIGVFIEVSKLRDTLNISAIYSLGQVLQKEDRNEKWYIFLAGWLVGEGRNATPGGGRWCSYSLKAKQIARVRIARVRFSNVHVKKVRIWTILRKKSPLCLCVLCLDETRY